MYLFHAFYNVNFRYVTPEITHVIMVLSQSFTEQAHYPNSNPLAYQFFYSYLPLVCNLAVYIRYYCVFLVFIIHCCCLGHPRQVWTPPIQPACSPSSTIRRSKSLQQARITLELLIVVLLILTLYLVMLISSPF